jgi:hypothetical protein
MSSNPRAHGHDGAGPGGRRRTISDAAPSPHLAQVSLEGLRAYRQRLTDEEDRVSYWRRLAQARIDILLAESDTSGSLSLEDLVRVLGDTGAGVRRKALVSVRAGEPLPDLPVMSEMWQIAVDPRDVEAVESAIEALRVAERQLTTYRCVLHDRIDEATGELISRYRANPTSALIALPRGRP